MTYILALDQGTSSSRALIYDAAGVVVGSAQHSIDSSYPNDGWVEQDPETIWGSILQAGREAIAAAGINPGDIAGIGITNQRETSLLWERDTSQCPYNAIVWQDRRSAERCETLAQQRYPQDQADAQLVSDLIEHTTGLIIDPYFSSTKLEWLLDRVDAERGRAARGDLCFGTVDSFLVWRLTKGARHVTDATNASRTQLFDIDQQAWSPQLLDLFNIPRAVLPEVLDCVADFGTADPEWFGAPIPICGIAGDQQAALIGQACFEPGMSKSTYGTGCFVMTNTGSQIPRSNQRLLATVAYRIHGQPSYALEGSIFVAGVAIQWLRDQLGLIDHAADTADAFARTGGDTGGVYVVPAFTGLGAPHWQPQVRGLIAGLTLDSNKDQIITAFLQSVAFQTRTLLQAMAADGAPVSTLRVDGGMVVNDAFCQFLCDLLDVAVQRPADVETTVRGAGVLAAIGAGLFSDLTEAAALWQLGADFTPSMAEDHRQTLVAGYDRAVAQALAG
ncbi:MAG: glycerol kinase GlpK [Gammaproteobacteria bacterium]